MNIEVASRLVAPQRGSPLDVTIKVNGNVVAQGRVPITAAVIFTANDCLDIGSDLGSPVSRDYYDLAPFAFNGTIRHDEDLVSDEVEQVSEARRRKAGCVGNYETLRAKP